jgi:hypothetical protein
MRDPNTIKRNLEYFADLGMSKERILANPQILNENPDALSRKLRMFKITVLGLKRRDIFNPTNFYRFRSSSPATLMAKCTYSRKNHINYKKALSILTRTWFDIMKMVKKDISKEQANKLGREMVKPYKKKYDLWMKDYKQWAEKFSSRRNRRIIIKV